MSPGVHDLLKPVVGGKQSLVQLLRQAKRIAATLKVWDLERWAVCDPERYPQSIHPPPYPATIALCCANPSRVGNSLAT